MPPTLSEIADSLERIERLTSKTAETVGILDERQKVMREDMVELKDHQKEANGKTASLIKDQFQMQGALGMLKIMVGLTLSGISAGAAMAGVILVIVTS